MREVQAPPSRSAALVRHLPDARAASRRQPERSVRVLLVEDKVGYQDWGLHGGGRMIMDWSKALGHTGVAATTVLLRDPGILESLVRREGLSFTYLRRGRYDPRTLLDLVSIMRDRDIQLVHASGYGGSTFGRLAARLAGVPAIVHVHADYRHSPMPYPWYVRLADRALAAETALVLLVSGALKEFAIECQGFRPEQLEIFHNPLDLTHFKRSPEARAAVRSELGVPADAPVVACVGRLEPVKGVDILLDAWPAVTRRCPAAVLLIVGDGPLRAELEEQAGPMAESGEVQFLGYREDVERIFAAADVAALPSRHEGLPRVALEAIATGCPVVAARVGGVPEIIRPEREGLLVLPDDPEGLAEALLRVLGDPTLRRQLGEAAHRTARRYGLPAAGPRLERIYRRVLAEHRSREDSAAA